jgi:hypothetical protein
MKSFPALIATVASAATLAAQSPRSHVLVPERPLFADSLSTAASVPIRFNIVDAESEGAQWVHRTEPTFQPTNYGAGLGPRIESGSVRQLC